MKCELLGDTRICAYPANTFLIVSAQALGAAGGKIVPATALVAGFGEQDTDGSIERTEAMIGEVLGGWGGILKSTPPAKLLSRPPVR